MTQRRPCCLSTRARPWRSTLTQVMALLPARVSGAGRRAGAPAGKQKDLCPCQTHTVCCVRAMCSMIDHGRHAQTWRMSACAQHPPHTHAPAPTPNLSGPAVSATRFSPVLFSRALCDCLCVIATAHAHLRPPPPPSRRRGKLQRSLDGACPARHDLRGSASDCAQRPAGGSRECVKLCVRLWLMLCMTPFYIAMHRRRECGHGRTSRSRPRDDCHGLRGRGGPANNQRLRRGCTPPCSTW